MFAFKNFYKPAPASVQRYCAALKGAGGLIGASTLVGTYAWLGGVGLGLIVLGETWEKLSGAPPPAHAPAPDPEPEPASACLSVVALLLFGLLAGLAACQSDQPSVSAIALAAQAQARRDSARAEQLLATAAEFRRLGQACEDSATIYHLQSRDVQIATTDTAALRSFFANYPIAGPGH